MTMLRLLGMTVLVLGLGGTMMVQAAEARPRFGPDFDRESVKRMVVQAAVRHNVPPGLALAVAKVESDFRPHAESSAGARGVMQIMPATARGEFGVAADRLWEPRLNIQLGVRYLRRLYRQYGNRWDLALSHYNGGTLRGRGARVVAHDYTRGYVAAVMGHWREFKRARLVRAVRTQTRALKVAKPAAYWLLEEPGVQRNWRQYLDVADRLLNGEPVRDPAMRVDDEKSGLRQTFQDSLQHYRQRLDEAEKGDRFM